MSTEENKAILRRLYEEIWNEKNLGMADELISTDFIDRNASAGLAPGIDGFKQGVAIAFATFPDIHLTIEDLIAEGDKVVSRVTARGTHKGEVMGIQSTGKQVAFTCIDIVRIADSKIVERWSLIDFPSIMHQLHVVPSPGQAG